MIRQPDGPTDRLGRLLDVGSDSALSTEPLEELGQAVARYRDTMTQLLGDPAGEPPFDLEPPEMNPRQLQLAALRDVLDHEQRDRIFARFTSDILMPLGLDTESN